MTRSTLTSEAYVWVWLPGADDPIPAGIAQQRGPVVEFAYGERYRRNPAAMSLHDAELPLEASGFIEPLVGLEIAGCLNDAGPDSWGQRMIYERLADPAASEVGLTTLTFLAEAASDRIGALDFQASARDYEPRGAIPADLGALEDAAAAIQRGEALPEPLARALLAGSSVGGARPKALLRTGERHLIAKFSAPTDRWPIVRAEFLAMRTAARCGLDVAEVELTAANGRDVLLVERFDREPGTARRRAVLSGLTLLGLPEDRPWLAAYGDLAEVMRKRFAEPTASRRELFARLLFNVLCGNTDDHARNHAALWDGRTLRLTPAYDICPYVRGGGEATQAMRIARGDDPYRFANVAGCIDRAATFGISREEAEAIADHQLAVVRDTWDDACDEARLTQPERERIGRVFPAPFALQTLPP